MGAEGLFLTADHRSHRRLRVATGQVVDALARWSFAGPGAWSGADPAAMARDVAAIDPCPPEGVGLAAVLDELGPAVLAHGVRPSDAWCAAHLQCPPLLDSAAVEVAVAATNQSMDSFDQAPAATLVEDHLVRWLAGFLGLPSTSSGVLTSGGTASNLLALYLARERAAPVQAEGLPEAARRWRVVASEAAHFSVAQAAGVLGLGRRAVATVAVDGHGRADLADLDRVLARLAADGLVPIALVATAGTTDHGAIDPLGPMADRAADLGAWFHVDAAVGGALALSDRLRPALAGLERADSATVDFHKLWWQPIAASALLVADGTFLQAARHPSDYLDRPDDDHLNLVARSLDTSRRFDALKVLVGLRTTGRLRLAAMVEHVVDVARQAADDVAARPDLELLAPPSTVTVLFRWRPGDPAIDPVLDRVNTDLQRRLFDSGRVVVGRTRVDGKVALKLTLVNPLVTGDHVSALLAEIALEGWAVHEGTAAGAGKALTATATAVGAVGALDQAIDASTHAFLNCYLRETGGWRVVTGPGGREAVVPLFGRDGELRVGIRYLSLTARHLFDLPAQVSFGGGRPQPVGFTTLVALLLDELGGGGRGGGSPTTLLARILESTHDMARYLARRGPEIDRLWGPAPLSFVESEQALLLGHLVHPTPKSRSEMSPAERLAYAPEAAARFRLHWFSVAPDLVRHDSATGTPAPEMAARLLGRDAGIVPDGRVLLPAHPWEAAHVGADPDLAGLFESGAVADLGPAGPEVTPTTSVRTVSRHEWPWQLKFSLHVRVTNSMRVTLPKELHRAVEAARLAATVVGARANAVAPDFHLVHDPAYLSVGHDGEVVPGFSVLFRANRWTVGSGEATDVSALTTLCQDRPGGGPSRLGAIVHALAARHGRPVADVGREWFERFCTVVVRSLVRLYLDVGLCFEAHQQNTLVELDDGWPARGVYRDSQGYFHRELAHDDLCRVIPHLGEASESIFPEVLADERLVYYLFLNLTLGVVNALGAAGCADEAVLLSDLRRMLEVERTAGGRYPATLLDRLLDDERWPCKANLATRLHDLDELVGDIATQSVYVTVPNPLAR